MTILLCMRLADMRRVHPDQIVGRCSACGHKIGIYPSGQEAMRHDPDLKLMCQVCQKPGPNATLAPGAELEPFESRKKR